MNKKIFILVIAMMAIMSLTAYADVTFSQFWKQDSAGKWYVEKSDGSRVTNAWLCDDAVAENGKDVWYLLDAGGNMLTAGLVQDGTGNFYSLETEHNGYYGMLRYKSGYYGGVSLSLEGSHNGSFAAVLNPEGIEALKAQYGVTSCANINNNNIVYTSSFRGSTQADVSSGSVSAAGNVQLSDSAATMPNYPGSFVIAQTVGTGWEEYRSPYGGSASYMFKYHGTPIKGWVCIDGNWWYSPTAQIDTPVDQDYAAAQAGTGGKSGGTTSGGNWEWPSADEVDERTVAEYFIEYLNDYRESLGKGTLRIDEERMEYAQERANRGTISHDGNTMGYEICSNGVLQKALYDELGTEGALAKYAFDHFKASPGHNSTMKLNTITTVGAGFMLSVDNENRVYGFVCQANFGKD